MTSTSLSTPFALAIAVAVLSWVACETASAQTTWHVPGDFGTIQAAITGASNGDEIVVAPGTYNEAIHFDGKAIHLRSSDGPEVTIIDASGLNFSRSGERARKRRCVGHEPDYGANTNDNFRLRPSQADSLKVHVAAATTHTSTEERILS